MNLGKKADAVGVEPGPEPHAPDHAPPHRRRDGGAGGGHLVARVDPQPVRPEDHRCAVRPPPREDPDVVPEEETVPAAEAPGTPCAKERHRRPSGVVADTHVREGFRLPPAHESAGMEPVTDEAAWAPAREDDVSHPVKRRRGEDRRSCLRASLDVGKEKETRGDGEDERPPEDDGGGFHGAPARASRRRSMTSRTAPRPPALRVT
jgi:hypothetical protein